MTRFRLAHLSDPHLGPLPPVAPHRLLSKRLFGALNWWRGRGAALSREILDALVEDIAAHKPDHIAVTGDLVNIALPAEFARAARWLAALGAPTDVTVVPGNHDAYVPGALAKAATAWAPFMRSDDGSPAFPLLRRRGPLALVGLSTAVATPPGFATGRVGAAQREATERLLDLCDDAIKVALIHHPLDATLSPGRRRLTDHKAVRASLAGGGVDLVLHGHTHRPSLGALETPFGEASVVCVPAASSDGSHSPPASYALIDIDETRRAIRLTRRGFRPGGRDVETLEVTDLPAPFANRQAR